MRPLLLIASTAAAALLGPLSEAQGYRVEPGEGPLTLDSSVAEAAAAWNRELAAAELPDSVRQTVELRQDPEADALIRFDDPALMGPDLVSVTLSDADPGLEVRLNPMLYDEYPGALLHELGLILGLPAGDDGVMNPLLGAEGPGEPTAGEITRLEAVLVAAAGDIDGDSRVGLSDLAALGRAYGERGVNLRADLDGNGIVGAEDIELLRTNYQFRRPGEKAADSTSGAPSSANGASSSGNEVQSPPAGDVDEPAGED